MMQPLPEFEKPPLVEVALSLQFDRLKSIGAAQLGILWQAFRGRFPKTQEHPPLAPSLEQFGKGGVPHSPIRVELVARPLTPRLWMLNDAESELVQVQQDRFVRNWRKRTETDEYPRYRQLREAFCRDYQLFLETAGAEGWGAPEPNQCEVTYVNVIPAGEGWDHHSQLARVVRLFQAAPLEGDFATLEEGSVAVRYRLTAEGGSPVGRLRIVVDPVLRTADRQPAIRLVLTARGAPLGSGLEGSLAFFDFGHEAVVRGFTAATTPEMHAIWSRRS